MVEDLEENAVEVRNAKALLEEQIKVKLRRKTKVKFELWNLQKKKEIEAQREELEAQLKFAESVRDAKSNAENLQGKIEWAEVMNIEKVIGHRIRHGRNALALQSAAETEKKISEDQYAVQEFTRKRDALMVQPLFSLSLCEHRDASTRVQDDVKNEKTKRDELLRHAQEVANSTIEEKRIHDELERKMKLFNKEKRDLNHEITKSEKELMVQVELKKKLQNKIDEMRRK